MITGRSLHDGTASGRVVVLDDPLSFWGGFDATTGTVVDQAHPQVGVSLTRAVVAMPGSRGSSGTPGVLGDALRQGTGPAALIMTNGDVNLVAGALVAAALYGADCPIVLVDETDFATLETGAAVRVADGTITPD